MNGKMVVFLIVALAVSLVALKAPLGMERNLGIHDAVSSKIQALDRTFIKDFDVYVANNPENPTALLFDRKDNYALPDRFWSGPLSEDEIIAAIEGAEAQYTSGDWDFSFPPRALSVVNRNGENVGYVYTSLKHVQMKRTDDGQVTVYRPTYVPIRERLSD